MEIKDIDHRAKDFIIWLETTGLVKSEVDRASIFKALVDQFKAFYYDVEESLTPSQLADSEVKNGN